MNIEDKRIIPDAGERVTLGGGLRGRVVVRSVERLTDVEVPREKQLIRVTLEIEPDAETGHRARLKWTPA